MPSRGGDGNYGDSDDRGSKENNAAATVIGVWKKIHIDPDFDDDHDLDEELESGI